MRIHILTFALAAAALQAGAITATKEYVDRRDTEIRTNTYTKAETDARIVEISPAPDMTGVVHGDDRSADKSQFEDGIKLRASDSDGGNMRLRVQDPMDNGISWYSDSSDTTLGRPFLRVNVSGIRHPTDIGADEFTQSSWYDISTAHHVLTWMPEYYPGVNTNGNYRFPISAGAFLNYFWNLQSLPSAATSNFASTATVKAASNLVDGAGAMIDAPGLMQGAAMLASTSAVPVVTYSAWVSDWPSDDEVQPLQPVWSNGTWSVKIKEVAGSMEWGPYSVAGAEDAVTFMVDIMGYLTIFRRAAIAEGDRNAYGLLRISDVTNDAAVAYSFTANDGTRYEITNYGFTETTATGILNGVAFELGINGSERFFYVQNVPPHGYLVAGANADVGWPVMPDGWRGGVQVNNGSQIYHFERHGGNLGIARLSDITNIVTKEYVEDLGIESGIQVETDPAWTAAKGEYAKTGTVAQVSEAVGTLWSYVYGDSVWIAVTNYMRTVGGVSPSFQLWEVRNGATNLVYWSKEEITNVTHDLIYDCKTNLEQTVRNAVADMPDKAWSKYQSATGNEAPDGVTIVSTPTIQLTGGGEWYRYVDVASNSVWFLKSNGLHTFGGDTNGYFRILDDEGNATFEVRKTDSYLVDAVASSVHFDADGNFCVSFESNIEPVIYTTASLESPNFLPQGDDPNVTVTWTQSGGTYTATLEQAVKGPSLFAYAKVEVQGETVIRNTVPTDLQGGIIVNGVKYNVGTATINGNTVLTLTPRN